MNEDDQNITKKSEDDKDEKENVYILPKIKKKKSFFRRLIKFLFISFSLFIVFLIAIILFIQTSLFKNWALHLALEKLNENLASKETVISVQSLEGSIIKSLGLINVSVVTKKDTLLKFDKLELDYNIFHILRKQIIINDVILFRPQINFTKVRDKNDTLIWNFAYVLKPEKPKEIDTAKKEPDWFVEINNLVIFRCNFRMLGNKGSELPIRDIKMPDISSFDMNNLDVKDLNLNLSAYYSPVEKILIIKSLNFKTNSQLNVRTFSCEAYINKNNVSGINNLKFETDKSRVIINGVRIENLNPLKGKVVYKDFKEKQISVDILTNDFNTDEIKFFLKDLNFLGGKVFMELKAKGNYGNFYIEKLDLNTGKSHLNIDGRVINLNDPSNLTLDVNLKNSELDPQDSKIMLPGISIPDFTNIGKVNVDINFKGEPVKFDADFDIRTSAGDFKGKTFLDVRSKDYIYKSDFSTKNLDIGKILRDDKLKSDINASIIADGKGIDYRTMVNKINYEITNSSVLGQNISKSGGVINSNNANFDLNLEYSSNSLSTKVQGIVDVKDFSNIKYNIKGTVQNLDVSSLTKNPNNKSNLNFEFDLNGVGYDPDKILGNLQFNVSPSNFADFVILATPLSAKFEQNGDQRKVTINSKFIDLETYGKFNFKTIPDIVTANLNSIIEQIINQYGTDTLYLDKNKTFTLSSQTLTSKPQSVLPDIDLIYKMDIKNLTPLTHYINDSAFTFSASMKGFMKNDVNSFTFKATGEVNNFKYGDSGIRFTKGKLDFDLTKGHYPYKDGFFSSSVDFKTSGLSKKGINLDSLSFSLTADENKNIFFFFGRVDTNQLVSSKGSLGLGGRLISFKLDTLNFKFFDNKLNNREKLNFAYKPGDKEDTLQLIRFDNFRIISSDDQRISIKGNYAFNDTSDLNLGLYRIKVSDLQMLVFPGIEDEKLIKGNLRRLRLNFSGTIDNPHMYVEANTDVLSLQKFKLGRLDAIIDYRENIARPEVSFYNPNNEGKLIISGDVPLRNPLIPVVEGIQQKLDFMENEVNLNITADNFQIRILEQLIPVISGLKGNLDGNINVNGIVKRPLLTGNMNVKNGSFKVNMTGTRYDFLSQLSTRDQKLVFQNFKIYYPGESDKIMNMNGYLDFSNLELNDLDLVLDGEIKLFDKEVSKNVLGVYGDLYGKSGNPPLSIKANSDRMDLTGNLLLTKGRIYIPPFKKDAYNLYYDNYIYKIAFDSLSFPNGNLEAFVSKLQDSLKTADKKRLDPFDNVFVKKSNEDKEINKQKYFHYEITINTLDKIFTNLVIDDKTGQEFFGNVHTTLYFDNNDNDSLKVRGRVDLEDNSIYKFYKNFKASGHVQFTGSMVNPELYIDGEFDATSRDPNDPNITRDVVILLNVRGETFNPKLKWSVTVNGIPIGSSDPTDEAISFIVFGKFKDELSAEQRINLVSSVGANVGTTIVSSYLSNVLQNYIPFIVNADINYVDNQTGNIAQNTDIRFTAEVGYATIRFGGQVFKDLSNTNFTFEYPINKLWKFNRLSNNLIFQFEHVVDPYSENSTAITGSSRTGGLIFYRIRF